jgi:hypothetical protein
MFTTWLVERTIAAQVFLKDDPSLAEEGFEHAAQGAPFDV